MVQRFSWVIGRLAPARRDDRRVRFRRAMHNGQLIVVGDAGPKIVRPLDAAPEKLVVAAGKLLADRGQPSPPVPTNIPDK